jgi:hypothetical protein
MSNFETSNELTVQDHYAPTAYDSFDHDDPDQSPIRGGDYRFDAGAYFTGKAKTPIEAGQRFIATDKAAGWLYLMKGESPQWLMHEPGTTKPERPECGDESTWPLGLDGKPACPWRWCNLLYLMNVDTGETLTLSGSTAGMKIAIGDLSQQIKSMRRMRPGAMPVIELQSVMMSTKWGSKARPSYKIVSWRNRVSDEQPPQQISDGRDYDAEAAEMAEVRDAEHAF